MKKNNERRWLYLLEMPIFNTTYWKIGVFTGYIASRINAILTQIDHLFAVNLVHSWELDGKINYNGEKVWLNYAVENQAHSYLKKYNYILPLNMSGKTEWFNCSKNKVLSAIGNAIQWAEKKPRPIPKESKVVDGRITKYFDKSPKLNIKTATKQELRQADIKGEIGNMKGKTFKKPETKASKKAKRTPFRDCFKRGSKTLH